MLLTDKLLPAVFLYRENRFVGIIEINEQEEKCHIMNPGRMVHFLIPGAQILVADRASPKRKLQYSLIYVVLPHTLILIDSQLPNKIVFEALKQKKISYFKKAISILPEQPYGVNKKSRIDFLIDHDIYLEVKATNHVENKIGYFPDAPTKRGQRHIQELIEIQKLSSKNKTFILFLAQRTDIEEIRPFDAIDPKFGALLRKAKEYGVIPIAYQITFSKNGQITTLGKELPVKL